MPLYAAIRTCSGCDSPHHDIRRCPNRPPSPPTHILVPAPSSTEGIAKEFAAFLAAKEAMKEDARRLAEQKAFEEAAAKKSEQEWAIGVFTRQVKEMMDMYYAQDNKEIIRLGKKFKISVDHYDPHEWIRLWRERRYEGKISRRMNLSEPQPGFDYFDGWPSKDEADIEVAKIAAKEWDNWISFCIRFEERSERL